MAQDLMKFQPMAHRNCTLGYLLIVARWEQKKNEACKKERSFYFASIQKNPTETNA
jgi:hypothetical protein